MEIIAPRGHFLITLQNPLE